MPKLSLLLGRKTLQVYDLDGDSILIGRDPEADVVIDNVSVSRHHAEIRRDRGGWIVQDLDSSNGTFLGGDRLEAASPLEEGDEIGIGKFSIVFGREVAGEEAPSSGGSSGAMAPDTGGTMYIDSEEMEEMMAGSEKERRAHLRWSSGGERGKHFFEDAPAALVGSGELCDLRVPKAPKHHLLVVLGEDGCEVRNLHWLWSMKVDGETRKRARLEDGQTVAFRGVELTYVSAIG